MKSRKFVVFIFFLIGLLRGRTRLDRLHYQHGEKVSFGRLQIFKRKQNSRDLKRHKHKQIFAVFGMQSTGEIRSA